MTSIQIKIHNDKLIEMFSNNEITCAELEERSIINKSN